MTEDDRPSMTYEDRGNYRRRQAARYVYSSVDTARWPRPRHFHGGAGRTIPHDRVARQFSSRSVLSTSISCEYRYMHRIQGQDTLQVLESRFLDIENRKDDKTYVIKISRPA